ncbi:hypothetical protein [Persephonella sp.]
MFKLYASDEFLKQIENIYKLKCKKSIISSLMYSAFILETLKDYVEFEKSFNHFFQYKGNKYYKIRIKDLCSNKGKSGGLRLILVINHSKQVVILLTIYAKTKQENILEGELIKLLNSKIIPYNPCLQTIDDILKTIVT